MLEHLADRNRRRGVLPDESNADWSSAGVGSSIQNIRYGSSAAPRPGLDRGQPVVDIVQQVDGVAELAAEVGHHLRGEVEVHAGFPGVLLRDVAAGRLVDLTISRCDAVGLPGPGWLPALGSPGSRCRDGAGSPS